MERIEKIPSPILNNLKGLANFFSSGNYKMFRSIGKKIRKFSHTNIESLYNDELSRWRPDEDIYDSNIITNSFFDKKLNFKTNLLSNYRYLMLRDFITYLPSNLLVKIDRASMANSLEVRNPYLDPSLVKFVWSLPDEFLNKNEIDKSILRDILAEKLSKNIYARKKQGFEPPLNLWLKGALKDWAYEIISENDDIINKKKLKIFFYDFLKGEKK